VGKEKAIMTSHDQDAHYMALAFEEAQKATCDRARVGCVLRHPHTGRMVRSHNTAPGGSPVCDDVGHLMHDGHCCRTTHAEIAALAIAATSATAITGATAYLTHAPCIGCAHALIAHGIVRIVYANSYRLNSVTESVLRWGGICLEEWNASE
jgi:dCMP deaminase